MQNWIKTLTAIITVLAIALGFSPVSIAQMPPRYDLLLKGGHVIDPANHINEVRDVAVYETKRAEKLPENLVEELSAGRVTWITFTSSSTVENFHARFDLPALLGKFPQTRTASIGPETSKTLVGLGIKPAVEAKPHTIEGVVKALESAAK